MPLALKLPRRGSKPTTNPYELLAAAHAGCFSVALANELGRAGFAICDIQTTATVMLETLPGGLTLTQIQLQVAAKVPRIRQCDFVDATVRAKRNCLVSRVLNATISMNATLLKK